MQEGGKWYPDFYATEDGLVFRSVGGGNHNDDDDLDDDLDDDGNSDDGDDNLDDDGNPIDNGDSDNDGDDDGDDGDSDGNDDTDFNVDDVKNLFDPNEYPKELQPAFKKMQAIFTKKMQDSKGKLDLVELMESNPEELVAMLAKKTGMTVSKEGVKKEEEVTDTEKWIVDLIKKHTTGDPETRKAVVQIQTAHKLKELDTTHPDWTMYEDEMAAIVKKYPNMSDDMESVYTLAKKSIDEAGAVIKGSKKKKQVSTKTTTKKKVVAKKAPKTPREALEAAWDKVQGK